MKDRIKRNVFLRCEGLDVTAIFRERHAFNSGQTIHPKPDPDQLYFFNAETGARL